MNPVSRPRDSQLESFSRTPPPPLTRTRHKHFVGYNLFARAVDHHSSPKISPPGLTMATIDFTSSTDASSTGLKTPISLHRTFGDGSARSRLTLVRSRSAPVVPSSIFVSKKKVTKVAKKANPTKKMTQSKHIQTSNRPPLAVKRQISDELGANAYNNCAKVLHSPFHSDFWQNIDSAASTFNEVQSDIEDAWNSLSSIIVSHVNVFSDGTTIIEQCEYPPPNLNDVDDDELFGLEFVEEGETNIGPFDYSLVGLEMEEEPLQVGAEQ